MLSARQAVGRVKKASHRHATVSQGSGGPYARLAFALRIYVHNPIQRQKLQGAEVKGNSFAAQPQPCL
jgi:hypothetical protein